MKYIITENKLRNIIKKEFGVDLTGNVKMITSALDVPYEFDKTTPNYQINKMLNQHGPMYLLDINGENFLFQPRTDISNIIIDPNRYGSIPEQLLWDKLGIPPFISIMDLINAYLPEED